jgi:hypothetical protein
MMAIFMQGENIKSTTLYRGRDIFYQFFPNLSTCVYFEIPSERLEKGPIAIKHFNSKICRI